jgi:GntR family transcriptional regulator
MSSRMNRPQVPLKYIWIARALQKAIESGELRAGDPLPSEYELMRAYRVSRNTARSALDFLMRMGLAYRVQGRGTFVAASKVKYGLFHLSSFTEEIQRQGMQTWARVLALEAIIPPPAIARALQLRADQRVIRIERLRLVNGKPLALHLSFVHEHLCPDLIHVDFTTASLYAVLEGPCGLRIVRSEQVLRAVAATPKQARLLGIPQGAPLLSIQGVTYLEDGTPLEWLELLYRGDRYELTFAALRSYRGEFP